MNYAFSIDALSPSAASAWRLQEDKSWRRCTYAEPMQPGDAIINDKDRIHYWMNRRLKKDKKVGLVEQKKSGRFDFLMRAIFAHPVLHRFTAAPTPDKTQMIATIKTMNPGTPWLLYLDIAGIFRALDTSKHSIIHNLDIAVRGEIASSAHYVGQEAAENSAMMEKLYHQFLAGWQLHLNTSNMQVFIPDLKTLKPEDEILTAIHHWQPE